MANKKGRQIRKRKQKPVGPGSAATARGGGSAAAGATSASSWTRSPRLLGGFLLVAVAVLGGLAALRLGSRDTVLSTECVLAAYQADAAYGELTIEYPLDETLFPPDIAPPTFRWRDRSSGADAWVVTCEFADGRDPVAELCSAPEWTPSDDQWGTIKRRSVEQPAAVTILGVQHQVPNEILSTARVTISTSVDEVGAPIFYREVHLPFLEAVKDPARHIHWRFGEVSSRTQPPVVLEGLPNCANCHSFTADGETLAMEVDSANDKGSTS